MDTCGCKKMQESVEKNNDPPDAATIRLDSLSFPWPLIRLIIDSEDVYASKSKLVRYLLLSHHLQLLVVFIISIACLAFGIGCFENFYARQMLCIIFIVQGASGLFVVFVYTSVITSLGPAFLMKQFSVDRRCATRYLITLAHSIIAFCIIWFFVGHVWFLLELLNGFPYEYYPIIHVFTILLFIIQYIIGIWLMSSCIHHNRRLMQRNREKTQRRLDQFAQCHVSVESIKSNKSLIDGDLILISFNHGGRSAQNVVRHV